MEKRYLEPIELLRIASQHAACADHLLEQNAEIMPNARESLDALLPIASLLHTALSLTFKAFLMHEHRAVKQHKTLIELTELNHHLGFSKQDKQLISTLSRAMAFKKGIDHQQYTDRQDFHGVCRQILRLHRRLHELLPIELHPDYQNC